MTTNKTPGDIADDLEGVITGAESALFEGEIETIGEAISYLRDQDSHA